MARIQIQPRPDPLDIDLLEELRGKQLCAYRLYRLIALKYAGSSQFSKKAVLSKKNLVKETVRNHLKWLLRNGCIRLVPNQSSTSKCFELTEKGCEKLSKIRAIDVQPGSKSLPLVLKPKDNDGNAKLSVYSDRSTTINLYGFPIPITTQNATFSLETLIGSNSDFVIKAKTNGKCARFEIDGGIFKVSSDL